MEHIEYYKLLKDVHKAVEVLFALDHILCFYYYFDLVCNQWVLTYTKKED